jgi:uncharacterized membrane protein YeiB
MPFTVRAGLVAVGLFVALLASLELGRRWGRIRFARDPEGAREGIGGVEGAVYSLLGLLVAFSFSAAAIRFEARRDLIVKEANAIGTAYLRLDLLAEPARDSLRAKMRRYVDSRIETYKKVPDEAAVGAEFARSVALQGEIWTEAIEAAKAAGNPALIVLPPALNDMIDITTTRLAATRAHTPNLIFATLMIVALVSGLLVGYATATSPKRRRLHAVAYAGVIALTLYVILDLEYPRLGLIRVDDFDQLLVEAREGMK